MPSRNVLIDSPRGSLTPRFTRRAVSGQGGEKRAREEEEFAATMQPPCASFVRREVTAPLRRLACRARRGIYCRHAALEAVHEAAHRASALRGGGLGGSSRCRAAGG